MIFETLISKKEDNYLFADHSELFWTGSGNRNNNDNSKVANLMIGLPSELDIKSFDEFLEPYL